MVNQINADSGIRRRSQTLRDLVLAPIEMDSGTLHSIKLGLVTVVLFASACVIEIKTLLASVSADLF
jgi:hypothetical protein